MLFIFWRRHVKSRLDIHSVWRTVHRKINLQLFSDKLAVLILATKSTFFDIGIIFYTVKIMILPQRPAQSMEELRLAGKKTVKRNIVSYTEMLFRTKGYDM